MTKTPPTPPTELRASGRTLWKTVMRDFALEDHERMLLRECCRTADSLDRLQTLLDSEGYMSQTSQGPRVHPALVELRQQRITLARLMTALRIPTGEEEGRTQSRGALRGVYGIGGAA